VGRSKGVKGAIVKWGSPTRQSSKLQPFKGVKGGELGSAVKKGGAGGVQASKTLLAEQAVEKVHGGRDLTAENR